MANIVTKADIDELGLSAANPALVDVAEPLVDDADPLTDDEGDGDGASA